ncbi:MAG: hypothetical protein JSS51_03555 [Planctomycetes bacterium]|nr:hypothetical protein [Planctomycetota bacterium]
MSAPTNTTSAIHNFQNGGKVIYEVSTGVYLNIMNIEPESGAVELRIGRRERIPMYDRNDLQQSRMGRQTPSYLKVRVRCAASYGSSDIMKKLLPIPTNTDLCPQHKIHVQEPYVKGGTTGLRWTLSKCELQTPIQKEFGRDYDVWVLEFLDMEDLPEPTEYSSELS